MTVPQASVALDATTVTNRRRGLGLNRGHNARLLRLLWVREVNRVNTRPVSAGLKGAATTVLTQYKTDSCSQGDCQIK